MVGGVGDAGELVKIVPDGAEFVHEALRFGIAARGALGGRRGVPPKAKLPDILAEARAGPCRSGCEFGAFGGGQLHPEMDRAPLAGICLPVPRHGGIPPTSTRLIPQEFAIWLVI